MDLSQSAASVSDEFARGIKQDYISEAGDEFKDLKKLRKNTWFNPKSILNAASLLSHAIFLPQGQKKAMLDALLNLGIDILPQVALTQNGKVLETLNPFSVINSALSCLQHLLFSANSFFSIITPEIANRINPKLTQFNYDFERHFKELSKQILAHSEDFKRDFPFLDALYSKDTQRLLSLIHKGCYFSDNYIAENKRATEINLEDLKVLKEFAANQIQTMSLNIEAATSLIDAFYTLYQTALYMSPASPALAALVFDADHEVLRALLENYTFSNVFEKAHFLLFTVIKRDLIVLDYLIEFHPNLLSEVNALLIKIGDIIGRGMNLSFDLPEDYKKMAEEYNLAEICELFANKDLLHFLTQALESLPILEERGMNTLGMKLVLKRILQEFPEYSDTNDHRVHNELSPIDIKSVLRPEEKRQNKTATEYRPFRKYSLR